MNKIIKSLIISISLFLFSCSSKENYLNCQRIAVLESYSKTWEYELSFAMVYEYQREDGHCIYTSMKSPRNLTDQQSGEINNIFLVYKEGSIVYDVYNFKRFVGFLTKETEFYLNLEKNIMIERITYSKWSQEANPKVFGLEDCDNNEAYKKAKKCYYQIYNENQYTIKESNTQTGMVGEFYSLLPFDAIITYTLRE